MIGQFHIPMSTTYIPFQCNFKNYSQFYYFFDFEFVIASQFKISSKSLFTFIVKLIIHLNYER